MSTYLLKTVLNKHLSSQFFFIFTLLFSFVSFMGTQQPPGKPAPKTSTEENSALVIEPKSELDSVSGVLHLLVLGYSLLA